MCDIEHQITKISITLSRQIERACVNAEYSRVSHLTDVTLHQASSAHSSPSRFEARASSVGKAFVLLNSLTQYMHHVGGSKCVFVVLGMKYSTV